MAKPETGLGYEFDAIAACVVGGVSLQGAAGSVLGAAVGCLLLQSLGTWITMSGFPDEYRSLVTGGVILVFVAVDAFGEAEHPAIVNALNARSPTRGESRGASMVMIRFTASLGH